MPGELREQFKLLAAYNREANERLYEACASLPARALEEPSAVPYSTILGLLHHLIASDEVWLARFEGDAGAQLRKTEAEQPNLATLSSARRALDDRIERFVGAVTDADLARPFRYKNSRGELLEAAVAALLTHMFNHQTHHRGQVQVLLRRAGVEGVSLDLHRLMGKRLGD